MVLRAADVDVGLARLAGLLWVATLAVWWRVFTGPRSTRWAALTSDPTPWCGSRRR
jgi:hypothetical protein